ncbi:hypothetical protein GCK72_016501 [Caenorhabditis remanei]|uniref:Uncharacterized protein n=1 Tax=Caenorhabditis remanei TaxID=31234 RepID=A0A6A5G4V6_CAERE|nr:hypothetical protein GCK72_016501 [Caenorhabditis remanei]KAF1749956.1 hypothetical protein GCK72_016501 [Caenorhabditis remanei]
MLAFLALSVAVATVSAQYGSGPSNNPPAPNTYSSNNVYYPPVVYDSNYWDYSRERNHKQCPKLRTYVGEFPSVPDEAFYPPIIRYVKDGKKVTAMVVCDRNVKNFNVLFGRNGSETDIRFAPFLAMGNTAGITLKCDRDERRFEGLAVDLGTPDFSRKVQITQLTCLGLDKTQIGLDAQGGLISFAYGIGAMLNGLDFFAPTIGRKKREAVETPATDAPEPVTGVPTEKVAETTVVVTAVKSGSETTKVVVQTTEAPAVSSGSDTATEAATTPAPGSLAALKAAGERLGKVFGRIFH